MSVTGIVSCLFGFFLGTIPGILLSTVLLICAYWYLSRPTNRPPGPLGVPFLGYIPFVNESILPRQYRDLSQKYGSIFSIFLGPKLVAIINGYEANRKAFVDHGDALSGRPKDLFRHLDPTMEKNLVFSDGLLWREHRRFALSKFRDYGIGRSGIEPALINEITYFLDEVEKMKNQDLNLKELLSLSICNNVIILELGKRLEYTDPNFIKLRNALNELFEGGNANLEVFFPWLEKIPFLRNFLKFDQIRENHRVFDDYMKEQIRLHRKEYQDGSDNDYINAYLTEKENRETSNNYSELFDDEALAANLKVLFFAGMETTTTTLRWAILYMILHPDIQRRVQKEIDDVIGDQRTPSCEDRLRMPYTEATLMEIQRMGTILPLSVMHRTTNDVEIDGIQIPKNTIVFPNLWSVHFDEKLYPDPHTFRPERFLNKDGKVLKSDWLIPFGLGKRFCLGEPLARMELFLYFAAIFQRFTLAQPKNGEVLSAVHNMNGAVNSPSPYKAHIILRNSN